MSSGRTSRRNMWEMWHGVRLRLRYVQAGRLLLPSNALVGGTSAAARLTRPTY